MKSKSNRSRSVAIVTYDIAGPWVHGETGAFQGLLADELARSGYAVTVIWVKDKPASPEIAKRRKFFSAKGIQFVPLPDAPIKLSARPGAALSYRVLLHLEAVHYDIVHFPDRRGLGYFPALAKCTTGKLADTILCIDIAGPTPWHKEQNQLPFMNAEELESIYLEREALRMADRAVAQTRSILTWLKNEGWATPRKTHLLPVFPRPSGRAVQCSKIDQIVYWGLFERRQGVELFCEALLRIPRHLLAGRCVTLLSSSEPDEDIGTGSVLGHVLRLLEAHPGLMLKVCSVLDRNVALDRIRKKNTLVVLPRYADNLGLQAKWCAVHGIPFLASRIPVHAELVSFGKDSPALFDVHPEAFAKCLSKALRSRIPRVSLSSSAMRQGVRHLLEWHRGVSDSAKPVTSRRRPWVSVCVAHRDRPEFLRQCLESIAGQTYRDFEVVLVDDASTTERARRELDDVISRFPGMRVRIRRRKNRGGPSVTRNQAAAMARGEFVFFMDDDNVAKPEQLEKLVEASLRTGADIVTSIQDRFRGGSGAKDALRGHRRSVPTGSDLALGLYMNAFGDMNALVRKKTYVKLKGLLDFGSGGHEDWEFFARAALEGHLLVVVPEPLCWYREHSGNYSASIDPLRAFWSALRPYKKGFRRAELFYALEAGALSLDRISGGTFSGHKFASTEALMRMTARLIGQNSR